MQSNYIVSLWGNSVAVFGDLSYAARFASIYQNATIEGLNDMATLYLHSDDGKAIVAARMEETELCTKIT